MTHNALSSRDSHENHDSQEHVGHQHLGHGDHEAHAVHDHSGHGDHDAHAGHQPSDHGGHGDHASMFRQRFWLTLILSIPVVLFSEMVQHWFGYSMPSFPGSDWVAPVLGTVIFFYGGRVFLEGGWIEIKQRQPGMMLLISLAIVVAFIASLATTFGWLDLDFWWELALLITIMLLGHWMEMRALGETRSALAALAELVPDEAERIVGDQTEMVSASELQNGDLVLVRPGNSVPADGVIESGRAKFDESMITGESQPVSRGEGDRVVAGTVVGGSSVRFRVSATGEETTLAGIQRMVEEAQSSRSRAQAMADRFAGWLFYIATIGAVVTFLIWWLFVDDLNQAVTRTVTLLVISCPHALGLAIPLVIAISTEVGAKAGVLVKDRLSLERMRQVTTVLFDKTGTLTRGNHVVRDVVTVNGDVDEALALAAAVEMDSEHPIAKAIVEEARGRNIDIPRAHDFEAKAGRGVQAVIDGEQVQVGGPTMISDLGLSVPEEIRRAADDWESAGSAVLYVVRGGDIIAGLSLGDEIRPESADAIRWLHNEDIRVVMITGDAQQVADAVGAELEVDEIFAQVLPENKQEVVAELQSRGDVVAMVGDGVNDAPALAQADVGLAIGAGTDVAIQSAGVILASSDPGMVAGVRSLSEATYRKMRQNLAWAVGYNVIAMPLASGVLAPWGFALSPAVGAVLMSLSTIIVAMNAQLLRRVDLQDRS